MKLELIHDCFGYYKAKNLSDKIILDHLVGHTDVRVSEQNKMETLAKIHGITSIRYGDEDEKYLV